MAAPWRRRIARQTLGPHPAQHAVHLRRAVAAAAAEIDPRAVFEAPHLAANADDAEIGEDRLPHLLDVWLARRCEVVAGRVEAIWVAGLGQEALGFLWIVGI